MTTPTKSSVLLPLAANLKACPACDSTFSEKLLIATWGSLKQAALEQGDELTPSIMAALILFDEEQFAQLLDEAERAQMLALAQAALERYRQKTNPPNKLGKIIAAALKEKEKI